MKSFRWVAVVVLLGLTGCTVQVVECECYNPPTADIPIKIESAGYGLGLGNEDVACEDAQENAAFACRRAGGSPGECGDCSGLSDKALKPVPDNTVPKTRRRG